MWYLFAFSRNLCEICLLNCTHIIIENHQQKYFPDSVFWGLSMGAIYLSYVIYFVLCENTQSRTHARTSAYIQYTRTYARTHVRTYAHTQHTQTRGYAHAYMQHLIGSYIYFILSLLNLFSYLLNLFSYLLKVPRTLFVLFFYLFYLLGFSMLYF